MLIISWADPTGKRLNVRSEANNASRKHLALKKKDGAPLLAPSFQEGTVRT
jgi:hypothetical protein